MQYEFRGKTLHDVIRKATTQKVGYKADAAEQQTCQQLSRWIDQLASDAGDLENEISDLQRHLENLEHSRSDNMTNAAIGAATAAAGALGSAARTARIIQRVLKGGRPRWSDVLSAIPYVGGAIVTARSALAAAKDAGEIRSAIQKLTACFKRLMGPLMTLNKLGKKIAVIAIFDP